MNLGDSGKDRLLKFIKQNRRFAARIQYPQGHGSDCGQDACNYKCQVMQHQPARTDQRQSNHKRRWSPAPQLAFALKFREQFGGIRIPHRGHITAFDLRQRLALDGRGRRPHWFTGKGRTVIEPTSTSVDVVATWSSAYSKAFYAR